MRLRFPENADMSCGGRANPHTRREHQARYELVLSYSEGKSVLDLGCGYGYGTALIADRAQKVLGVDRDPEAIATAQRKHGARGNVDFECGDAFEFLSLTRDRYDIVVLFEVLEHIGRHPELIDLIWRVTSIGGRVFVSTPNKRRTPFYRVNPYHIREVTAEELLELVGGRFTLDLFKGQTEGFWGLLPHLVLSAVTSKLGGYEEITRLSERPERCKTLIVSGVRKGQ